MSGKGEDSATCYSCREPLHCATKWAKSIQPNDKRHWLLHAVSIYYFEGVYGCEKDTKKSIKLCEREADLGNRSAQDSLAQIYYLGDSGANKCLKKARYYAKKAANQGAQQSQFILAHLLWHDNYDRNEEAFRLLTLAAFQGSAQARSNLGSIYEERYQATEDEAWDKNLILSLYWYGKGAELEAKDPRQGCKSLAGMAFNLNLAMSLFWHPRDYSNMHPLPGYSHVPFYTWALAKSGQHTKTINFPQPRLMDNDAWQNVCANCGKQSREKQELKACSSCKAFHYCSKKCQVKHWKAGHKVDCKGHWIEEFFPDIR
jgi:hypothetical protein